MLIVESDDVSPDTGERGGLPIAALVAALEEAFRSPVAILTPGEGRTSFELDVRDVETRGADVWILAKAGCADSGDHHGGYSKNIRQVSCY